MGIGKGEPEPAIWPPGEAGLWPRRSQSALWPPPQAALDYSEFKRRLEAGGGGWGWGWGWRLGLEAEAGAGAGWGQAGYFFTSWRAMMVRWISLVPSPISISGASR